jgi:hypothetical protein
MRRFSGDVKAQQLGSHAPNGEPQSVGKPVGRHDTALGGNEMTPPGTPCRSNRHDVLVRLPPPARSTTAVWFADHRPSRWAMTCRQQGYHRFLRGTGRRHGPPHQQRRDRRGESHDGAEVLAVRSSRSSLLLRGCGSRAPQTVRYRSGQRNPAVDATWQHHFCGDNEDQSRRHRTNRQEDRHWKVGVERHAGSVSRRAEPHKRRLDDHHERAFACKPLHRASTSILTEVSRNGYGAPRCLPHLLTYRPRLACVASDAKYADRY